MILYADPSELRKGTRLPKALVERARPLPNLESRTGADLLLTPLRLPVGSDTLLRRHTEAGLLIQRKTGTDITNSITDGRLSRSLLRMQEWTDRPWLVVVAAIGHKGDLSVVDGRPSLPYQAVLGALDRWQWRGGYVTVVVDDWVLIRWLGQRAKWLEDPKFEKYVSRTPQQNLVGEDWKGDLLTALPGVGTEKAKAALAEGRGRVALALQYITGEGRKIPGIGATLKASARRALGLEPDEQIVVMDEEWLSGMCGFLLAHDEEVAWDRAMEEWGRLMELVGIHSGKGGSWEEWAKGEKGKGE